MAYTTPLGASTTGPQYTRYTVTNSAGQPEVYEVDYQAIDVTPDICLQTGTRSLTNPACYEGTGPVLVYQQVLLPTGKAYVFKYANNTPADLQELDLPTGGKITYTYGDFYQAALQVEVQHFAEKMLHGQIVSAVEFGGAYRAPGAEG